MGLTSGRVFGPMTEWLRVSFCDIHVNVKDIFKSLELPEVVHAALIKADWIPLPPSCERSCMGYNSPQD